MLIGNYLLVIDTLPLFPKEIKRLSGAAAIRMFQHQVCLENLFSPIKCVSFVLEEIVDTRKVQTKEKRKNSETAKADKKKLYSYALGFAV